MNINVDIPVDIPTEIQGYIYESVSMDTYVHTRGHAHAYNHDAPTDKPTDTSMQGGVWNRCVLCSPSRCLHPGDFGESPDHTIICGKCALSSGALHGMILKACFHKER